MSIVNIESLKQNNAVLYWPGSYGSANAPKTITAAGNVTQMTPVIGAGVLNSPAYNDFIQIGNPDDLRFADNTDFTVEFWMNGRVCSTGDGINIIGCTQNETSNGGWCICVWQNTHFGWWDAGNAAWFMNSPTSYLPNVWAHYAFVRRTEGTNKVYRMFVNGILVKEAIGNAQIPNPGLAFRIGAEPTPRVELKFGTTKLSELRISNVARYTTNFTPSRQVFGMDTNTKLLLHFNSNGTTFTDETGKTVTRYGDAKCIAPPVNGAGMAYFDGNGDYLTCGAATDWNFLHQVGTTGKWTIRFWYKWIDRTHVIPIFLLSTTEIEPLAHGIYINISTSRTLCAGIMQGEEGHSVISFVSTALPDDSNWHHIMLTYDQALSSENMKAYCDGSSIGTETKTSNAPPTTVAAYALKISYQDVSSLLQFKGYLSDLQVINGVCLDGTITPTEPVLPNSKTALLLHFDGMNQAFYGSSYPPGDNGFPILPDGVSITPSGTFTSVKGKDGRNYWKFDGSTNYITLTDHANWSIFLNNFTISAWVKFDTVAANKVILGQYADANNQWYVKWTTSNVIQLYGITSSTARFDFTCPLTPVAGTWYHVVVQRSGSSCVMYINGVVQTVTQTTAFSATATDITAVLSIGKINTEYQAGNTKDLQIFTKALTMDQVSALMSETYIY